MNSIISFGVLAALGILAFWLLNSLEVMTFPEMKESLFYNVIYASENSTVYNANATVGEETVEDPQLEQIATKVHDIDIPISSDSLELIISNSTLHRNTNFFVTLEVMAHRTGNLKTFWNIEMGVAPGYEIVNPSTTGYQNTTTHAHGKSQVTWELVSSPTPSENPDAFEVTAMAYDYETGALLQDSPVSASYEIVTINTNPIANSDNFSASEDVPIEVALLLNDFDADGDSLMISEIWERPYNGFVALNNNSDSVVYSPNDNFFGNDTFSYTIRDIYNGTSSAEVSIDIIPVNDPPVAADDHVTTQEDVSIDIDVLENDSDPDIDASIRIVWVSAPINGTAALSHSANSTVITYIPSGNFSGNDSFDYIITDGSSNSSGKVSVFVEPVNDAPGAKSDNIITVENQSNEIRLKGCDPDGDQLSFHIVSGPSNGSLGPISVSGLASAHVTYTPNRNYHGTDNFTFMTNDGTDDSTIATVFITVSPDNSTDGSNDTDENSESSADGRGGHDGRRGAESTAGNATGSTESFEKLVIDGYKMLDENGKEITCIIQGTEAKFAYIVTNSGLTDYNCVLIWELGDQDGVARNIQIKKMTVPRFSSITYNDIRWSGDALGKYDVRLFLWTDLERPTPLSKLFLYEFNVERE